MIVYILIRSYLGSPGYEILSVSVDRDEVLKFITKELAAVPGWDFSEVDRWVNSEYEWEMKVSSHEV
jgi:hypothetical protein